MSGPPSPENTTRRGLVYGIAVYFKAIDAVPALDIVAHRILWSLPFLALLLFIGSGWREVADALRRRRTLTLLVLTSVLIGINWLLYVYAVTSGHILAASLGYYLNPLANVLLGRFVLKERLSWIQWTAIGIAAAGIAVLAAGALDHLWISLVLCVSFATYGLLRKITSVDSVAGLAIETTLLAPLALLWLVWTMAAGLPAFGTTASQGALLALAGVVSTTPLLLFTAAARRLRYSSLGMLQFLAPTLQFLLAVFVYGEAFTSAHAIAFGAIWTALLLYVIGLARAPRVAAAPE
jgi:chloramphenicol-sensitive protein RarD